MTDGPYLPLQPSKSIQFKLDRLLRVRVSDLPPAVLSGILSVATHEDPGWVKDKVRGLEVSEDDHYLFSCRYSTDRQSLFLSRGLRPKIARILEHHHLGMEVTDNTVTFPPMGVRFREGKAMYPYQDTAVTELVAEDEGILEAPPGAGKTVIGCGIIERLQQPTLIVVTTLEIMDQWINSINDFLTVGKTQIGKIGGGKGKWKPITVATFQSLNNFTKEDWDRVNRTFGTLLIDECHHTAAPTILDICNNSKAKNRYGVTATVRRKDGREFLLFDAVSPRIVTVSDEDAQSLKPDVEFIAVNTKIKATYAPVNAAGGGVMFDINWAKLYNQLAEDKGRNAIILANVVRHVRLGHRVLVLSQRVEHCQDLFECLKELVPSVGLLVGRVDKDDRKDILKKAKSGNVDVLVATNGLAAEGLDVPCLSCVHITMPTTNKIFLKQAAGRSGRPWDGKLYPLVADYVDTDVPMLFNMGKSREKTYGSFGYKLRNSVKGLVA